MFHNLQKMDRFCSKLEPFLLSFPFTGSAKHTSLHKHKSLMHNLYIANLECFHNTALPRTGLSQTGSNVYMLIYNRTVRIRHQCRKTTVLSCHRCLTHINIDKNFYHQMSLSKSKCQYSNNCLHFLMCVFPLIGK